MKISNLPSATSVGDEDVIPVVQNGTTKKLPKGALALVDDVIIENGKIYLVVSGKKIGLGAAIPQLYIDEKMSDTSTNPVQNKVAKAYVDGADKQLMKNILSKFEISDNLYNESSNTSGYLIGTDGGLKASEKQTITDYIFLEKGDYIITYTSSAYFALIAQYDLNKSFKSGTRKDFVRDNTDDTFKKFKIDEDCYVRFSGTTTKIKDKEIMLVKGDTLPDEYVPYVFKLKGDNTDTLTNVLVGDTDFIKTNGNLINRMTIERNMVISEGVIKTSDQGYAITGKICLKPSTTYTATGTFRISYFDREGTHLSSEDIPSRNTTVTFETPSKFDYALVTLYFAKIHDYPDYKWQLNEGSELLPYEPQHLIIDGYRIYDEPDVEVDIVQEMKNKDEVVCDRVPVFSLDSEVAGIEYTAGVDVAPLTSSEIFDMYNALQNANPDYITKTELGLDDEGKMMYRYDFKQPKIPKGEVGASGEKYQETQQAKIILIAGVHNEYNGIYSLYNTMEQITNNPKLFNLKSSVHFIVVPVVNIFAVDNRDGKRSNLNSNGVNIGLDFEYNWEEKSSGTGIKPLSQKASQYIANLMAENKDAMLFVSCHSFARSETYPKTMMWCPAGTSYTCNLAKKVIEKLSKEWITKYPDKIPSQNGYASGNGDNKYLGATEVGVPRQNEKTQALMNGIQAVVFEVCENFYNPDGSVEYLSSFICSRGTEVYINFLLTVCQISSNEKANTDEIKNYIDEVIGGIENGSY